jgi:hypothetical protein
LSRQGRGTMTPVTLLITASGVAMLLAGGIALAATLGDTDEPQTPASCRR